MCPNSVVKSPLQKLRGKQVKKILHSINRDTTIDLPSDFGLKIKDVLKSFRKYSGVTSHHGNAFRGT